MSGRTIFVTGATGLIGAEVVARLAAKGHAVIALVHQRDELIRNDGRPIRIKGAIPPKEGSVAVVRGDVVAPNLGLTDEGHELLRSRVDRTVHCAATTDFGRSREVYEAINITGTKNVLDFVADVGSGPIPLVHVSTAYVCGDRAGHVYEHELDAGQKFSTEYERSKFVAEMMVRERADKGAPTVVVRPSIVVGAARSGVVREYKNMYVVLKLLTEGRVRSIPGYYDATLDLVPVDYVADVVVESAIRFDEAAGRTFHAVGAKPFTLRDFSDVLAEYPPFHVPRYVPPSGFSVDRLPAEERVYYERVLALYESFFRRRTIFAAEAAVGFLGRAPAAHGKPHLRKVLDHCLRVGYLGAPQPDVHEVLTRLGGGAR